MRTFKAICATTAYAVIILPIILLVALMAIVTDIYHIIVYWGEGFNINETETYEILDIYKDCIYEAYKNIKRG